MRIDGHAHYWAASYIEATSVQDIPEGLRLSRDAYSAHQLVLGSDAIFASLTAEEKHLILEVNAERLLHHHLAATPRALQRG